MPMDENESYFSLEGLTGPIDGGERRGGARWVNQRSAKLEARRERLDSIRERIARIESWRRGDESRV